MKLMLREAFKRLTNASIVPFLGTTFRELFEKRVHPTQETQVLLSQLYKYLKEQDPASLPIFDEVGFRCFSQFEEDGILLYIFSLVGTTNKIAVEMCAGDGVECNTTNFIINHGWKGFLFDGNLRKVKRGRNFFARHKNTFLWPPRFTHAWITAENVNDVLRKAGVSGEVDLLSLDMDGVDYWIWKALEVIQPRVVICETHNVIGPDQALTVPYDPNFKIRIPDYHSASLCAMNKLAVEKGYRLVGAHRYGFNAFFIRRSLADGLLPEISVESCLKHPYAVHARTKRWPKVKNMKWQDVGSADEKRMGFDPVGDTHIFPDKVLRGIRPGNGTLYREILRHCRKSDIFKRGLIPAQESQDSRLGHEKYELVLEHPRIPFMSYPHEWCLEMLRDAALLQLDLHAALLDLGLTLKDSHPWNILFDGTRPVFIDFTSLLPCSEMPRQEWLGAFSRPEIQGLWEKLGSESKYFYENYRRMFYPYFLLPLYGMCFGMYGRMRRRLFETTLNASREVLRAGEVLGPLAVLPILREGLRAAKLLWGKSSIQKEQFFLRSLHSEIQHMKVSRLRSKYTEYYREKGESQDFVPGPSWNPKQNAIRDILAEIKPDTVLDVASNTGWFSILAATMGSRVVAFDEDQACVSRLYREARSRKLDILPLVMDFNHPSPEVWSLPDRMHRERPLLFSAQKRLPCKVVLALAIVHHLSLGAGKSFAEILQKLHAFTLNTLVLEFVPKDDALIQRERSFFKAYRKDPGRFDGYTLENLRREMAPYFEWIGTKPSHPAGRVLIVAKKIG